SAELVCFPQVELPARVWGGFDFFFSKRGPPCHRRSLPLARERQLNQAPNCFRARGVVWLALGPLLNFGGERGRCAEGQHRVLTGPRAPTFFGYYLFA